MEAHLRETLDLLVRWVHLIAGIMWIGNSMLFNWLDRNLVMPDNPKEGLEGEIWLVHSGGFYQVEKKQLAPSQLPATLHWFKWQNGVTWLSGILLLGIVYYMGGGAYLVDAGVSSIGVPTATALGIAVVVFSWVFYDLLWNSPLGKRPAAGAVVSFLYLAALVVGLSHALSGRAAYIHVGVVLGTVMTGNVWLRILPSQRELIAATRAGKRQDSLLAQRAKQRSIHNNYMTFPLLFIMVSNHFPSTYGSKINYAVLALLMVAGAVVRHLMNIRFWYRGWLPPLVATVVVSSVTLFFLTAPPPPRPAAVINAQPVSFRTVRGVFAQRCVQCHSQSPTDTTFTTAPNKVMFDTPDEMKGMAAKIKDRVVISKTMPLGNKTGITEAERDLLGDWVDQGAPIQ